MRTLAASILLLPALTGCLGFANCSGSQGMTGQEGVCNEEDSFYFGKQGTFSGTETFTWENTGTKASVAWGGQGAGQVKVVLEDAAGKEVFSKSFSGSGQAGASTMSSTGQAGAWTVTVSGIAFQGQVGVAINKA